jgi:hypothetical protein
MTREQRDEVIAAAAEVKAVIAELRSRKSICPRGGWQIAHRLEQAHARLEKANREAR